MSDNDCIDECEPKSNVLIAMMHIRVTDDDRATLSSQNIGRMKIISTRLFRKATRVKTLAIALFP
jgi:hypothetical protein